MTEQVKLIDYNIYSKILKTFKEDYYVDVDRRIKNNKWRHLGFAAALIIWVRHNTLASNCELEGLSNLKFYFDNEEDMVMFMLEWK